GRKRGDGARAAEVVGGPGRREPVRGRLGGHISSRARENDDREKSAVSRGRHEERGTPPQRDCRSEPFPDRTAPSGTGGGVLDVRVPPRTLLRRERGGVAGTGTPPTKNSRPVSRPVPVRDQGPGRRAPTRPAGPSSEHRQGAGQRSGWRVSLTNRVQ